MRRLRSRSFGAHVEPSDLYERRVVSRAHPLPERPSPGLAHVSSTGSGISSQAIWKWWGACRNLFLQSALGIENGQLFRAVIR